MEHVSSASTCIFDMLINFSTRKAGMPFFCTSQSSEFLTPVDEKGQRVEFIRSDVVQLKKPVGLLLC